MSCSAMEYARDVLWYGKGTNTRQLTAANFGLKESIVVLNAVCGDRECCIQVMCQ